MADSVKSVPTTPGRKGNFAATAPSASSARGPSKQRKAANAPFRGGDVQRRSQIADDISAIEVQIAKQKESIRMITDENEQLKRDVGSVSDAQFSYADADRLANLQGEVDAFERHLQFEKVRKNELTKRSQLVRIDLMQSRKSKGGVNVDREQADTVQRQVEVLESRLDQALVKFNDTLSTNRDLREQIDAIREERRVFQRVCKRLDGDLLSVKGLIASHLEQANKDYEERDTYYKHRDQLGQSLIDEQRRYDEELQTLNDAMRDIREMREEQQQMQLELATKQYETQSRSDENAATPRVSPSQRGAESRKDNSRAADTTSHNRTAWENNSNSNAFASGMNDGEMRLEDAVAQLRVATGEQDIEVLYNRFTRSQNKNASSYNYTNELTAEMDLMKRSVNALRSVLTNPRDSQRQTEICALEANIADVEEELESVRGRVGERRETLDQVRDALATLHKQISAEGADSDMDGGDKGSRNLLTYLAATERRADAILLAFQNHHNALNESQGGATSSAVEPHPKEAAAAVAAGRGARQPTPPPADREGSMPPASSARPQGGAKMLSRGQALPANTANTARELVLQMGLPTSSAPGGDGGPEPAEDVSDDFVVSHDMIRAQMGERLQAKREREERSNKKKRDRDAATLGAIGKNASGNNGGGGAPSGLTASQAARTTK